LLLKLSILSRVSWEL